MSSTIEIVCLAKSRKHSGRCIAGKEMVKGGYGGWIRPTSSRPSAEISEEERRYENGSFPQILDTIAIPIIGPAPFLHQVENHVINADYYWVKTGVVVWKDLPSLVDKPATLWLNGDSTYNGVNDRVTVALAADLNSSLYLIEPENLSIKVSTDGAAFGNPRRRVRAEFRYRGSPYSLIVTDVTAEKAFLAKENGSYDLKRAYLWQQYS